MGNSCGHIVDSDVIRLTYFPAYARAELIRITLAHTQVEWENRTIRVKWGFDIISRKLGGKGFSPSG